MTRNNQFYKDLSFKYFRGEITASEEKELFEWLKAGENRMATLHEWEDEWKDTGVVENTPVWESMLGRIAAREALETSDVMPRRKMSPWIGAVAAAVVALFGAIFLLARPEPVQEYAMEAPAGEKSRIFLPDSSVVWLNSGSKLFFNSSFNSKDRRVALVGEGYFEVSHNEQLPFRVTCGDVDVLVKGTKFNVSAYTEDLFVTTSVLEGHVVFSHGDAHMDLLKGQSARYDVVSGSFSRSLQTPENESAWTESRFVYEGITLSELAEKLSRTYAVRFHFNTPEHLDGKFNISLRNNESLDDVLRALEKMIPIKARREGDNVYIDKR